MSSSSGCLARFVVDVFGFSDGCLVVSLEEVCVLEVSLVEVCVLEDGL